MSDPAETPSPVTTGCCSVAGTKPVNEDAFALHVPQGIALRSKGVTAVIADGVSGAEAARDASRSCVRGFVSDYYATPDSWSVKRSAHRVLSALNRWLHGQGFRAYGTANGLVSTFSAVIVKSATAHLVHVGDTRIQLIRNGQIEPLTNDHKTVLGGSQTMLSRALGAELAVDIDYAEVTIEQGDLFILTSDGVHDYLPANHLLELFGEAATSLDAACEAVVNAALGLGSRDNLTCVALRVESIIGQDEAAFYRDLTQLPFPPPLNPGMVLDGYRVLRELHASKRTQLYLALDELTGERVVMKTPSVNYEDDALYIDQFLHEEWIGRRLDNPHVMRVFQPRERRQCLYYVAEYIQGQTLRQWMSDHPRPSLTEVRHIVTQLIRALRAFQRLEMIHQDLKPENVMIDAEGTVKLIDFGSTKVAGLAEVSVPIDRDAVLGTLGYTAPEYLTAGQATFAADLYSLGTLVYEMLTGKLPYGEPLTQRKLYRLEYRPAAQYNEQVPGWVDGALARAVHRDPLQRQASLSEFEMDLSQPNPRFERTSFVPLMERDPLTFWRTVAALLLAFNLLQLLT